MFHKGVLQIIDAIIHKSNIYAVNREYRSVLRTYDGYMFILINGLAFNYRQIQNALYECVYRKTKNETIWCGTLPKNY